MNNLAARLDEPPSWLGEFAAYLAARHCVGRCCEMISSLGRLLVDEHPNHPSAVLERARQPGRSMGSLARGLEEFFTDHKPRCQPIRPSGSQPVDGNAASTPSQNRCDLPSWTSAPGCCGHGNEPAEPARGPQADGTIESALAAVRDFANFLITHRSKDDWALVDVGDVETFLAARPRMRARHLSVLRQFFTFARAHHLVLADPTRGVPSQRERAFSGRTLTLDEQRALFRRWTSDPGVHPHEALLGVLALLHGAASRELRLLRVEDVDAPTRSVRLGQRPHPVPLDPPSWTVLQRCLTHREQLRTDNPHVLVTRGTKALRTPASTAYLSHVLDPADVAPHRLRVTRLADLVNTMDPKLVAATFGMNPEGVLIYLADHVDRGRLPRTRATSAAT